MKKRVLSLFLALTLCLTLLPTAAFAEGKTGGEDGTSDGSEPQYVAQVGETKYETMQDALDEMSEDEITLLDDINEAELSTSVPTTINMNGYSITGDIEANDSLTLENGTVKGKVTVDAADGAFIMTAPAGAEAAIDGGLEVNDGSCSVSGAKIGVKDTLFFGDDKLTISGTEKAVELNAAAGPSSKPIYGFATVDGDASTEAVFDAEQGTYMVNGEAAQKLSNKQEGGSAPVKPVTLTLTPETANVAAGETATFTATYTGTDELKAYIQKNGNDENFDISTPTNDGDGTYTITVKIAEETPTGDYTLYVHETKDTSMQAMAKIHVKGKDPVAEVIHPGATEGTKYFSLPAALDAAKDGETVKLLADHTTDWDAVDAGDELMAVVKKILTLDLNGKTVDYLVVGEVVPDEEGGILESTEGSLTIKDSGLGSVGTVSSLQLEKGKLTIEGGEIGTAADTMSFVCSDENGEVNIKGGLVWFSRLRGRYSEHHRWQGVSAFREPHGRR